MKIILLKATENSSESSSEYSSSKSDKYVEKLQSHGWEVVNIPVITFKYVSIDILWQELQAFSQYDGIIFSSPRCVQSVEEAIKIFDLHGTWKVKLCKEWIKKRIFCVGPATASFVVNFFEMEDSSCPNLMTSESCNAKSMGESILASHKQSSITQRLLYPCGNLRKSTIENFLVQTNIPYNALTTYETVQHPDLKERLENENLDKTEATAMVFFSPSGIDYSTPYLTNVKKHTNMHFIALGPTTREALEKSSHFPPDKILQCEYPTPDALVETIITLRSNLSSKSSS